MYYVFGKRLTDGGTSKQLPTLIMFENGLETARIPHVYSDGSVAKGRYRRGQRRRGRRGQRREVRRRGERCGRRRRRGLCRGGRRAGRRRWSRRGKRREVRRSRRRVERREGRLRGNRVQAWVLLVPVEASM